LFIAQWRAKTGSTYVKLFSLEIKPEIYFTFNITLCEQHARVNVLSKIVDFV